MASGYASELLGECERVRRYSGAPTVDRYIAETATDFVQQRSIAPAPSREDQLADSLAVNSRPLVPRVSVSPEYPIGQECLLSTRPQSQDSPDSRARIGADTAVKMTKE